MLPRLVQLLPPPEMKSRQAIYVFPTGQTGLELAEIAPSILRSTARVGTLSRLVPAESHFNDFFGFLFGWNPAELVDRILSGL